MYCVYILYSASRDRYYIGYTANLAERIKKHNTNHAGFTGKALDWELKFTEAYSTQSEALKRERQIKGWKNRKMIEKLIRAA